MTELATPPVEAGTGVTRISHWIGGRTVAGESGRSGVVFNPATGRQSGAVDFATVEEVDRAVQAAKETIAAKGKAPGHIESLVTAIKPAVEATAKDDLDTTIKANVKNVVQALRSSTPILKAEVDSGKIQVVGGYYSLDTGAVTFLDQ